jgi:hypothetical protein
MPSAHVQYFGSNGPTMHNSKKRKIDGAARARLEDPGDIDFDNFGALHALFGTYRQDFLSLWENGASKGASPCVVRGEGDKRLKWLRQNLSNFDPASMLEATASDAIHVWLLSPNTKSGTISSIKVSEASQALQLYGAGHSLYCRAPRVLEDAVVPSLLNDLGWGVRMSANAFNDRNARGEIETFFSKKGHVTEWHTDFQENFTIQLTGTKKWTFRQCDLNHPLRGCTPHFGSTQGREVVETQLKAARLCDPSAFTHLADVETAFSTARVADEISVVLTPGDVLYHPAGILHKVECMDDSVAINISLYASSCAEIVCGAIQQMLCSDPAYRAPPQTGSGSGGWESVLSDMLKNGIPAVLSQLTAGKILPPTVAPERHESHEKEGAGIDNDEGDEDLDGNGNGKVENEDEDEDEDEESEGEGEGEDEKDGDSELCIGVVPGGLTASGSGILEINPLCSLLLASQLKRLGWTPPSKVIPARFGVPVAASEAPTFEIVLVVHSGFGNEMLESTNRQCIAIPVRRDDTDQIRAHLTLCYSLISSGNVEKLRKVCNLEDPVHAACVGALLRAGALVLQ